MIYLIVQKKKHWMDSLSQSVIDAFTPEQRAKYDRRYQRGDLIEIVETLNSEQSQFYVIEVPDATLTQAENYLSDWERDYSVNRTFYDGDQTAEFSIVLNNSHSNTDFSLGELVPDNENWTILNETPTRIDVRFTNYDPAKNDEYRLKLEIKMEKLISRRRYYFEASDLTSAQRQELQNTGKLTLSRSEVMAIIKDKII